MRVETGSGRLKISDNPYPFWAFCALFVLGGMTALSLSPLDTSNPTASSTPIAATSVVRHASGL